MRSDGDRSHFKTKFLQKMRNSRFFATGGETEMNLLKICRHRDVSPHSDNGEEKFGTRNIILPYSRKYQRCSREWEVFRREHPLLP